MLDVDTQLKEVLIIVVACGLVGGLAFELLTVRKGGAGQIELPGKGAGRMLDLGVLSSLFIGAVAAVGFLIVYQPVERIDGATTSHLYPRVELIGISLVVGAAGSTVLRALTSIVQKMAAEADLAKIVAGLKALQAAPEVRNLGVPAQDDLNAKIEDLVKMAERAG